MTPGFRFAGGRETLLAGSPVGTCTVWLLYWSFRGTVSSLMNLICAFLSFFLLYSTLEASQSRLVRFYKSTYTGVISTLMLELVALTRCVTSSVLNTQLMKGSPSSTALALMT